MRERKRGALSLLFGLLMIFSMFTISASAENNTFVPGMIMDGSTLTLGESAFSPDYGLVPFGEYLAAGGCSIVRRENDIATVDGYTSCYRVCDELYLGLFMDRLEDDGSWHTVYIKEVTGQDANYLSYSINVFVMPGYYYRVRAGHIARFGTVMESNISATDGIFFGEHDED